MKLATLKSNKRADVVLVDHITGDTVSAKVFNGISDVITIKGIITRFKVKMYDGYTIIRLRINNNGYYLNSIMINHKDLNKILSKLVIGNEYKFKGCIKKVYIFKIFIIKEIEIEEK